MIAGLLPDESTALVTNLLCSPTLLEALRSVFCCIFRPMSGNFMPDDRICWIGGASSSYKN
jgi:hypothetical protein